MTERDTHATQGVLRCAGRNEYGPCADTIQHPPAMKLAQVRTLVKATGWSYRGTAYGWAWFCPIHDPNKQKEKTWLT